MPQDGGSFWRRELSDTAKSVGPKYEGRWNKVACDVGDLSSGSSRAEGKIGDFKLFYWDPSGLPIATLLTW